MAGDFFKGEKKKKKKGQASQTFFGSAPVFTPPTVASKGKNKF